MTRNVFLKFNQKSEFKFHFASLVLYLVEHMPESLFLIFNSCLLGAMAGLGICMLILSVAGGLALFVYVIKWYLTFFAIWILA